jgi:hypothetical protein
LVYSENTFELWPQSTFTTDKFLEVIARHSENARLVRRVEIIVELPLFHHNDYILWPQYDGGIVLDLEKLKVVVALFGPKYRISSNEDEDEDSVDAEVDMEDEDDGWRQYDLAEALWRAMNYLHITIFTRGGGDPVKWFHENRDVVAWDDGGNGAIRQLLDKCIPGWRRGRTEWGRSRAKRKGLELSLHLGSRF